MRFLHTSDWHLGMSIKTDTMIEDQEFFFEQIYKIIVEENIDAVVMAGDVYDSSVTNSEAIELYNKFVTKICNELHKSMIVISGNHDSGSRLASCRKLLCKSGLYVSGRLEKDIVPVSIDNTDFYMIPYFNRDEVLALFPEKKKDIKSVEDAYKVVCNNIRENMDNSRVNVVISHAYIVGAELSDSDRAAQVGNATAVSKDVFEGFDYVALGHIHKPQAITTTIRYSGSPIKYSFGSEEKQTKIVIIYDTDDKSQKDIPLKMKHNRQSIQKTYEELMNLEGFDDYYLDITVTDRIMSFSLMDELEKKFPYMLSCKGINNEANKPSSDISIEQLKSMNEKEILLHFFKEIYESAPTKEQLEIFNNAVIESEKEDNIG